MIIQEAYDKISLLKKVLPKAFVFVIDTTDRSFLYKSEEFTICEQTVLSIDASLGIDKLSKKSGYHLNNHDFSLFGFKNIGTNTYLGFCLPKKNQEVNDHILAKDLIACI